MKQLIFTLTLLPFLAAYPAAKPADANANASACAADVKSTAADAKAARDEKAQSAAAQVDALEARLFPNISMVFNNILGMEQELLRKITALFRSHGLREKYGNAEKPDLLPPLWQIVYDYAIPVPQVTCETFRELFSIADCEVIEEFYETVWNLTSNPRFLLLLSAFHMGTKLAEQWPYDSQSFRYILSRGFRHGPGRLYLNRFTLFNGDPDSPEYLQPWYRKPTDYERASLGEHQFDKDPVIEFRNRMDRYNHNLEFSKKLNTHAEAMHKVVAENPDITTDTAVADLRRTCETTMKLWIDEYDKPYNAWRQLHTLFGFAASWKRVMRWVATLSPEDQQKWRDELALVLPNYRDV